VVFTVFGLPVRDTVISTWLMIALITGLMMALGRWQPTALEMLFDFLSDTITDIIGRDSSPYLPLLGTLAIFIAVANVVGVVPFLTSPTRDLNAPVALALVVFFAVHYFGVRSRGFWGYLKSVASPLVTLPFELIGQFTRTLSLTLRLFGNVLSIELIVAVIFALMPLFVPLPLIAFSIFTGLLQAYIFTALAAVYIGAGLEVTTPVRQQKNEQDETT
jgi:F-type H+-transporting ATPase subunit a